MTLFVAKHLIITMALTFIMEETEAQHGIALLEKELLKLVYRYTIYAWLGDDLNQ